MFCRFLYCLFDCFLYRLSVFSLGLSQHVHKITNPWKFELNWSSKLRDNNERKKKTLSHQLVCFQMLDFGTSIWGLEIKLVENYFFLENYVTSEGAVYHRVLYYQPLPITRYQVTTVSTAFKVEVTLLVCVHSSFGLVAVTRLPSTALLDVCMSWVELCTVGLPIIEKPTGKKCQCITLWALNSAKFFRLKGHVALDRSSWSLKSVCNRLLQNAYG